MANKRNSAASPFVSHMEKSARSGRHAKKIKVNSNFAPAKDHSSTTAAAGPIRLILDDSEDDLSSSNADVDRAVDGSNIEPNEGVSAEGNRTIASDIRLKVSSSAPKTSTTSRISSPPLPASHHGDSAAPDQNVVSSPLATAEVNTGLELPAGHRLFYTTELLEKILVQLPFMEMLHARRIAHKSNAVIANSTDLKRIIYLAAREGPAHGNPPLRTPYHRNPNIIACGWGPNCPPLPFPTAPNFNLVHPNPLLFLPSDRYLPVGGLTLRPSFEEHIFRPSAASLSFFDEMYITNPPVDRIEVAIGTRKKGPCDFFLRIHNVSSLSRCGHKKTEMLVKDTGVKVSDLLASIQAMLPRNIHQLQNTFLMLPDGYEAVESTRD
ncbi:hypothetical protein TI39_contig4111g00004 [Zymoseptoria brevis]|uniref:F-box domain-containing protein n=1 Tax=Zymoseptoria brevis TaxID=1047168 RepID=A0A0F4GET3_9PEZI|nr:hypothetical protein TI39_contig4111g00004 [Zymoseptoria brevis]